MIELANEQQRRDNRRAVLRRKEWRQQYSLVSQAIRTNRAQLKQAHQQGKNDAVALCSLRSLKLTAHLMMLDREDIAWDLRNSAYRWVDLIAA
jgi:hypothetical protein